MTVYLYYILLGIYGLALLASVFYYAFGKKPQGDASVGWAMGIVITAGLAVAFLMALACWNYPGAGIAVLCIPLVFRALPRIRSMWTDLYARLPVPGDTPLLRLVIQNNTALKLRVRIECWFATSNSHSSRLYTSFDYQLEPGGRTESPHDAYYTRLLAHKSKFVAVQVFELVEQEHDGHKYLKEIQPAMQYRQLEPAVFRTGEYTIVIDDHK